MSIVIAAIRKNEVCVLGDTQLNDDNGVLDILGQKVFPFGKGVLLGMTGDYKEIIKIVPQLKFNEQKKFNEKVDFVQKCVKEKDINAVLAGIENGIGKFAILGMENSSGVQVDATGVMVKVLLPKDIDIEFCQSFMRSTENVKRQMITCIEAVAKKSKSVNNKVLGFCTNGIETYGVEKNINRNDLELFKRAITILANK